MGFTQSLIEDGEFIADCCRFAEGITSEAAVRKKYHFSEEAWERLGVDDKLIEAVEAEKVRRIRSGAAKREKAQLHVVAAPDVLSGILMDPKANAKHRIDSAKALDDLAGFAPQATHGDSDRVIIRIDLSADTKNPADVLMFEAAARPKPSDDGKVIDARPPMIEASDQFDQQEPVKRRPGRPPGSKNKPKTTDDKLIEHESRPRGVPGFEVD